MLATWPQIGPVRIVYFPDLFLLQMFFYNPNTTAPNDSIDAPKVRLVRGLKIAHLNVNRLVNKLDGVRELMSAYIFDVLALSETWLSPKISDCKVTIPGYSVVQKDRTGSTKLNGGGVLLYIRDNVPFTVKNELAANNENLLWVEINRPKCKPPLIAAAYKPPRVNLDHDFVTCVFSPFGAYMQILIKVII